MTPKYMRELRRKIDLHFNLDEIEGMAFDLGIDWEHLKGENKLTKIRSLISYQANRGELEELLELLLEERRAINWVKVPTAEQQKKDMRGGLTDRERDTALQSYLKNIEPYLGEEGFTITSIAMVQAYTNTTWPLLDSQRKKVVIQLWIKTKLFERLSYDGIEFENCLVRADLSGVNLVNLNLTETNLSFVNFEGSKLTEVVLREANLNRANLRDADLSKSDFRYANLNGVNLSRANLSNVDFDGASFDGANLTHVIINNCSMVNASFYKANLSNAMITSSNLESVDLGRANLSNAKVKDCFLYQSDVSGADLRGANLRGSDLAEAHLTESGRYNIDLTLKEIIGPAILNGSDLRGVDLSRAEVTHKQLQSAYLDENTIMPDGLKWKES